MNVLWCTRGGPTSGYGGQTALAVRYLKAAGHAVTVLNTSYEVAARLADGTEVLPRLADPHGNDVVEFYARRSRADLVVSLVDPHVLVPEVWGKLPWVAWAPVDCEPAYPGTVRSLKAARKVLSLSRFGQRQLEAAGVASELVPHGVDLEVFRPQGRCHAAERLALVDPSWGGRVDRFVVLVVAQNRTAPSRKGFFEAFSAFKTFAEARPDAHLHVHAEASDAFGGEHLGGVAQLAGLRREQVSSAPQHELSAGLLAADHVACLYSAADVLLSASHTEGFCLPLAEAQACGCPVVATDCSAQPELVGPRGHLAEATPYMAMSHSLWRRPVVSSLVAGLEHAREARGDEAARQETAAWARGRFDAAEVFPKKLVLALEHVAGRVA